ncbi:MAG: hypothetical protein KAZ48_11405 [Candidatus Nanopelagicales bacterium]|nr:hypothetical protein [Candidatus Nanopelagicales bacterium]
MMAMSECDCGQVEIPLGLPMCNLNGTLHGVTACVDKDRWEERALEAEAAIARVRERAGGPIPAVHGDWMAGYAAAMRDILSALGHDIEMEGKR